MGEGEALLRVLAESMRAARQAAGVSLNGMAQLAGVSKGFLSEVERARKKPSPRVVATYDRVLGCGGALLGLSADYRHVRALSAVPGDPISRSPDTGTLVPGDASEFLYDVTPDGVTLAPGEQTIKQWAIRNAGTVTWRDRRLARIGRLAGPEVPRSPAAVPVPLTRPGESVVLSVPIYGASVAGTRTLRFKMVDAEGRVCFPELLYGLLTEIISIGD
jgi:transcriptional regulator with XRE-family HTH domain